MVKAVIKGSYYIQNEITKKFYSSYSDEYVKNWYDADSYAFEDAVRLLQYERKAHPRSRPILVALSPNFIRQWGF